MLDACDDSEDGCPTNDQDEIDDFLSLGVADTGVGMLKAG